MILRRLMSVAKDVADNAATAVLEAEAASAKEASEGGDGGDKGISAGGAKAINKRRTEKEKAERVRDEVERYCEKFEKEVLKLFDRSYRKGDPRMMAVSCESPKSDRSSDESTVQRPYKTSTGEHPASKFTSINTISSSPKIVSWKMRSARLERAVRTLVQTCECLYDCTTLMF